MIETQENELLELLQEWSKDIEGNEKDLFTRNKIAKEVKRLVTSWGNWQRKSNLIPFGEYIDKLSLKYKIPRAIATQYILELAQSKDISTLYGDERKLYFELNPPA